MNTKKYLLLSLVLLVVAGISLYIVRFETREAFFEVYFFKLNRGRSIFLQTPHGKTILIDGGQNSEVIRELTKVLPFYRRNIDVVIATRADAKNVGGLIDVLKRYDVGKIYVPILMGTSTAFEALEKTIDEKGIETEQLKKGDEFAIDSVQFTTIFPDPTFSYNKSNVPELVLKVSYGTTTLVFFGDVSPRIQKSLVSDLGNVYLVEFAHGATKSRVSADLLNKLLPNIVVSTKKEETVSFKIK